MKPLFCIVLLLIFNTTFANDLKRISADPELGIISVEMENNVRAVVDQETQTMLLMTNGITVAYTYQQLAEIEHPNDPAAQAIFVNRLFSSLTADNTPYSLLETSTTRWATDYSRYGTSPPSPGGGSGAINTIVPANAPPPENNTTGGMWDWLGGPCDLGPCTPSTGRNGRIFYSYDSQSSGIGSKSPSEQTSFRADYESYRAEVCGLGIETGGQVVGWGSAGLACRLILAAPTPFNFVACGLGITAGIIANAAKNRAERNCKNSYPGKGNW